MQENIEISLEDLQEQHRRYAETLGMDTLLALCEAYGGTTLYIPKIGELLRKSRYRAIYEEYDGSNRRELARKYNVSEATIYRIVRDKRKYLEDIPGQMDISDFLEK